MARLPRLYAPDVVQHVVQRPLEGRLLFGDPDDYLFFTDLLEEAVYLHAVALHAYVLLPGEVRLLATPPQPESIARLMQTIGRRYVPHLNRKTNRRGALWDRRYRSTLIDADAFLLPSMRFIEGRPVAAALVAEAGEWRWSSHSHHIGREQRSFLIDHGHYWALSDTPFGRQALYRDLAAAAVAGDVAHRIDEAVERGWVMGDEAFVATLRGTINRRPSPLPRGRPRRAPI